MNCSYEFQELMDKWTQDNNESKRIINNLVEFLFSDLYWLNKNISQVDREILKECANKL